MKIYQKIAGNLKKIHNGDLNTTFATRKEYIEKIVLNYVPNGNGFDKGTEFLFDESTPNKLVFHTHFHHKNKNGKYCGWTQHDVIITPDLSSDFNIIVYGIDKFNIKELISDTFSNFLWKEIL